MSDAETIDRLRGWPPPSKSDHPANVGPSEYRYSAQQGQWIRVSGDGPATVTPLQEGGRLVCFDTCTLTNHARSHTFTPGDVIYVEEVREKDILFIPVGGVLTLKMGIPMVDRHWRCPPPAKEKPAYAPPKLTELTAADVTRKLVAELHNRARNLDASILLAYDGRKVVTLHASTQPGPTRVDNLTELLGGPITIVTAEDRRLRDPPERMTELAETFPSLQGNRIPGVRPWEPILLMRAGGLSHGELCSVRFVLWVWDPHKTDWPCGQFELGDAIGVWDATHRKAFTDWASKPWWP